jgi:hypothetical protein
LTAKFYRCLMVIAMMNAGNLLIENGLIRLS